MMINNSNIARNKEYAAASGDTPMFKNDNEISFRVDEAAYAAVIDRLTDVYDNPAISAVREVFSNAYDATMREFLSTNEKNEIVITMPSFTNEYYLSIRDNGSGMSMEDIKEVFTGYGTSTKVTDLSSTGAFGLGAKSPLALVSSFKVVTVKDGQKVSFTTVRHAGTVPKIIDIVKSDTDERNGTIFYIPTANLSSTQREDMGNTIFMLANFSATFPVRIENTTENDYSMSDAKLGYRSVSLKDDYSYSHSFEHGNESFRVFVSHKAFERLGCDTMERALCTNRSTRDNLLNKAYLLNGYVYQDRNYYNNALFNAELIIELKPGVVDFPSSRDNITENSRKESLLQSFNSSYNTGEDFAHLIAQIISKTKNNKKEKLSSIYKTIFKDNDSMIFLKKVLENDNKVNELGELIELGEEFKALANKLIAGKKNINGAAYLYNFDDKAVGRFDNNQLKASYFPRKSEANYDFSKTVTKLNNASLPDTIKVGIPNLLRELESFNAIITVEGFDKKTIGFSRKFSQMDSRFGGNKETKSVMILFPANGKLLEDDKSALSLIAKIANVELVNYESVNDIPLKARNSSGSTITTELVTFKWKESDIEAETVMDSLIENRNAKDFKHVHRAGVTYKTILEELREENNHLLIIPKAKRHESGMFDSRKFTDNALILSEKYGTDFVQNNTIYVMEHPNQSLTKSLEEEGIEYTVIGHPEKFTRAGLADIAITPHQTSIEIETIMSKFTPEELEKELVYQLFSTINRSPYDDIQREYIFNVFTFVIKHKNYFSTKDYNLATNIIETIDNMEKNSVESKYSTRIAQISRKHNNNDLTKLFKGRVANIEERFSQITMVNTMERMPEVTPDFARIYDIVKDNVLIKTLGVEKVAPLAKYLVDEYKTTLLNHQLREEKEKENNAL